MIIYENCLMEINIMSSKNQHGKLYFTIGLPRSGKSGVCNNWVNYHFDIVDNAAIPINFPNNKSTPRCIICSDDIRLALHGQRFQSLAEDMVHSIKTIMIRAMLNRGQDVIIDGTHMSSESIRKIFEIDIDAQYLYMSTSKEVCIKRAIQSGQRDLIPIIEQMSVNDILYNEDNPVLLQTDKIKEIRGDVLLNNIFGFQRDHENDRHTTVREARELRDLKNKEIENENS